MTLEFHDLAEASGPFERSLVEIPTKTLYARVLSHQTRLCWQGTCEFLQGNASWNGMSSVLDVGCGPGELVLRLVRQFPEKSFVGVDIEPEFIRLAKDRLKGHGNCTFECADFFQFSKTGFDGAILWAVLQHLRDVRRSVRHLASLLADHGSAVFFDQGQNQEIQSRPELPLFNSIHQRLREEAGDKRNADCMRELESGASDLQFTVDQACDAAMPILGDEASKEFVVYALGVAELVRRFYGISTDFSALRGELLHWYKSSERWATLNAGRWCVLRKTK